MAVMMALLACVAVLCPSMVGRRPAVEMVGRVVQYCCVVTLYLRVVDDLFPLRGAMTAVRADLRSECGKYRAVRAASAREQPR
jgi:hypothetical protein